MNWRHGDTRLLWVQTGAAIPRGWKLKALHGRSLTNAVEVQLCELEYVGVLVEGRDRLARLWKHWFGPLTFSP